MRVAAETRARSGVSNAWQFAGIVLAVVFAASMWLCVNRVLVAHQLAQAAVLDVPRGNLSDLYPRWLGARELLLHHRDPYGADITREIQAGYYGRPIDPSRPNDPKDQQAFAYPLYVVFLLAPTVKLPFVAVQRGFFYLLVVVTAGSVLLWMRIIGWRTSVSQKVIWVVLVLGCFPAVQGLKLQQLSLLVGAIVAGSMAAVVRGHFVGAGILLAAAMIKPQLVVLLVLWLLIWVLGNWRERQTLMWSFLASMVVLVVGSTLLLPGWMGEFRSATAAYTRYTEGRSELELLLTPLWGKMASTLLVLVVLASVWGLRTANQRTAYFRWSMSLALAATLLVIPMSSPHYQVLLLPGLMLIVLSLSRLWNRGFGSRLLIFLMGISIVWPWLAALALVVALQFRAASEVLKYWLLPFLPFQTTIMSTLVVTAVLLTGRSVFMEALSKRGDLNTT